MAIRKIRCSSLPRFMACPSSEAKTETPYRPVSPSADLGSAVHEALALFIDEKPTDLGAISAKWRQDIGEVTDLFQAGVTQWRQIKPTLKVYQAEVPLDYAITTGTADVVGSGDGALHIIDWKTGRVRADYHYQLMGYAVAANAKYTGFEEFQLHTVWLRDNDQDTTTVTANQLSEFVDQYRAQTKRIGKQYNPGSHCAWCPRQLECPAKEAYVRTSAQALAELDPTSISRETLADLYEHSKTLSSALAQFNKALRMELEQGALSLPNGKRLELTETSRDTIDARKAWPMLLRENLTEAEINQCLSLNKGKLLDLVGSKADDDKASARKRMIKALHEVGAITRSTFAKIGVFKETKK